MGVADAVPGVSGGTIARFWHLRRLIESIGYLLDILRRPTQRQTWVNG